RGRLSRETLRAADSPRARAGPAAPAGMVPARPRSPASCLEPVHVSRADDRLRATGGADGRPDAPAHADGSIAAPLSRRARGAAGVAQNHPRESVGRAG